MSADWWQNFANNFAADLAPLISLVGESPTKQYLSETLTFVDVFIFSMAPIGVLTTLVSVIRVAGGPPLRAFIGKAQEGAGIAEAELCSSTSRNVCELYNNGGIARVFGRPKILEFVHDWEPNSALSQPTQGSGNAAGIYSFRDYVKLSSGHWKEKRTGYRKFPDVENHNEEKYTNRDFAPHPNLSLNLGIKRLHRAWFYLAAILGFALQAGVLAFAALVTYEYPIKFKRDDTQIAVPAFPFACAGTVLLCIGVAMCASIIERSTYERTFKREENQLSRLYWIQPGDQIVGDQVFDCFAFSDAKDRITEYTTSKREIDRDNYSKKFLPKQSVFVWVATIATTVGFILQFLGLRTLHSTVSVAQLGAMLIMSIVRALLRTRHLREEHNLLGNSSTLYLRHELDWLALEMAQEDHDYSAQGVCNWDQRPGWRVTGPAEITLASVSSENNTSITSQGNHAEVCKAVKAYLKRVRLAQMTGAQTITSTLIIDDPWEDAMVAARTWASKLAYAVEGVMSTISLRCKVKDILRQKKIFWHLRCRMSTASDGTPPESTISLELAHDPDGTGLQGSWKADRAQLEGVLGLWLWSWIPKERIKRDEDPPGTNKAFLRNSHLLSVLRACDHSEFEANFKRWFGNHEIPLRKAKLNLNNATPYPGNPWVELDTLNGKVYQQVSEERFKREKDPTARRLFGSNVIATSINSDPKEEQFVLHTPSASSLEMMCAQELFAIFFNAVVLEIEDLGANTEILTGFRELSLAHSTLSEMIKSFTSAGIGNHDDAISCMIPVLHHAQKLTYSSAFAVARAAGEKYRGRRKWVEAENSLFPALKLALQDFESVKVIPLPGDTERTGEIFLCLLSLCELYRWALLDDKPARLFGLHGFISLFGLWDNYGEVPKDLILYKNVALHLCNEEIHDREINQAIQQLKELSAVEQPDAKVAEDFQGALYRGDISGALYSLRPSILGPCTERPILALAAEHGWYSITKSLQGLGVDTRTVDHNGLNYLHHAAQSCHASMFKDLVGNDNDLLHDKDNYGRTPLHLAAGTGRTDVVILLIRHFSVPVNIRDHCFRSPLDNAILADHSDIFTLLFKLEKELVPKSPLQQYRDFETLRLFQAVCCCSVKVVRVLLAAIIDSDSVEELRIVRGALLQHKRNLESNENVNPECFIQILDTLDKCGYCADEWQLEGRTGLSFAAEADKSDLVAYLLDKCTEGTIIGRDLQGKNCLHHAVISESASAVEALIESKYANSLLVKDKAGLRPLEYAFKNGLSNIATMLLCQGPRSEKFILPGTSIAANSYFVYFQSSNSCIGVVLHNRGVGKLDLRGELTVPARISTPLAIIGDRKKHRLYYVSEEDTLSNLYHAEGCWRVGTLQESAIQVGTGSCMAVCHFEEKDCVFYQDRQDCIRGIVLHQGSIRFLDIGIAAKGSGIAAIIKEDGLRVYFQNRGFEVEEASVTAFIHALETDTQVMSTTTILPIRGSDLELRTQLLYLNIKNSQDRVLCCDKEGHIRLFQRDNRRCDQYIVAKPKVGPTTRLALTENNQLFYRSNSGDIRQMKFGTSLTSEVVANSTEGPDIVLWCDDDSSPSTPTVTP